MSELHPLTDKLWPNPRRQYADYHAVDRFDQIIRQWLSARVEEYEKEIGQKSNCTGLRRILSIEPKVVTLEEKVETELKKMSYSNCTSVEVALRVAREHFQGGGK